jgi:predicted ATPase
MALIAICGSQGQGKTTVLASLQELGYTVSFPKTSRSILNEWDVSLEEVNRNPQLKMKFQDEIIQRHYLHNMQFVDTPAIVFTERSFADIFVYTILSLGPFNEFSQWLDEYYERCKDYQKIYQNIFKLEGRVDDVENDGVRSVNRHFTQSVDTLLRYYLDDFGVNVNIIDDPDHESRIKLISDWV